MMPRIPSMGAGTSRGRRRRYRSRATPRRTDRSPVGCWSRIGTRLNAVGMGARADREAEDPRGSRPRRGVGGSAGCGRPAQAWRTGRRDVDEQRSRTPGRGETRRRWRRSTGRWLRQDRVSPCAARHAVEGCRAGRRLGRDVRARRHRGRFRVGAHGANDAQLRRQSRRGGRGVRELRAGRLPDDGQTRDPGRPLPRHPSGKHPETVPCSPRRARRIDDRPPTPTPPQAPAPTTPPP